MRDFHFPGRSTVHAQNGMVATSHPLASQSALQILREGGSAMDAAITAAAVLAVVEPHMTGIGGDCFALLAPKGGADVLAFNGSGRSPAAASLDAYRAQGVTEIGTDSVQSVTLPGAVEGWARLHADHGRLEFARLLQPAIEYARGGYPVHARVRADWAQAAPRLAKRAAAAQIFLPDGRAPEEGAIHRQERLADTLETIAKKGARGFYDGPVAEAMAAALQAEGGVHTLEDFRAVKGDYVTPASSAYRGVDVHQIPPNNQGVTALVMLNILEGFDIAALEPLSAARLHLEIEAGRIAFDMRNRHLADLPSLQVPLDRLLSKPWAAELRARISPEGAMTDIGDLGLAASDTVYLSVVDRDLNAVSFINSIYHGFGSTILCPQTGVMFQNRGASFRMDPAHPNALAPNKRPMHTIMPGMVTRDGKALLSFGVMGGDYQPYGHARVVSNLVDYGLDLQSSIDMPRVFAMGAEVDVERSLPADIVRGLAERGHPIRMAASPHGGGQAVLIDHARGVLSGASDARKDGCALGY